MTVAQIAGQLQRQRGAIRSRIMKLNLICQPPPKTNPVSAESWKSPRERIGMAAS
jgi:hypothetical protein